MVYRWSNKKAKSNFQFSSQYTHTYTQFIANILRHSSCFTVRVSVYVRVHMCVCVYFTYNKDQKQLWYVTSEQQENR